MTARPSDQADRPADFGAGFSPSMLLADYAPDRGWGEVKIVPRQPLALDPATMVMHYGQAAFEGLRAHRQVTGGWALFRARDHAERLARSCLRMAIPPLPEDTCIELWRRFVAHEVVTLGERAVDLYLRPLIFGCDPHFGDQPSTHYQLIVLGVLLQPCELLPCRGLKVLITDQYVRAAPGGIGSAKVPGNYGAGMLARQTARALGCDQVLWLDAGRRRWIEELGSMNVAFVIDNVLVTPSVTDTILNGVTRATVLTLAREAGLECEERPIALEELTAAMSWQGLTEAMGLGTGAGIVSIESFRIGERWLNLDPPTPVADHLRELLIAHQKGALPDSRGWLTPI